MVDDLAVRAHAFEGALAPDGGIVAGLFAGIGRRNDKQPLPLNMRATVAAGSWIQSGNFHGYAFTPAAARIARFTATRASETLYAFWLSGLASATAAFAAASAVAAVTGLPESALPAAADSHGVGATCPMTTLAEETFEPCIFSVTEAAASGQSSASFWRTSYVALLPTAAGTMISVSSSFGCSTISRLFSSLGASKNLAISTSREPFADTSFTFA